MAEPVSVAVSVAQVCLCWLEVGTFDVARGKTPSDTSKQPFTADEELQVIQEEPKYFGYALQGEVLCWRV